MAYSGDADNARSSFLAVDVFATISVVAIAGAVITYLVRPAPSASALPFSGPKRGFPVAASNTTVVTG